MRLGRCADCGEAFVVEAATGRPPARCLPCHRDHARAMSRDRNYRWRAAHPGAWKTVQDRANAKRLADPDHRREKRERETHRNYGLTPEDLRRLEVAQGDRCAVCRYLPPLRDESKPLPRGHASTRLHVDHDHKTGRVRGLLCGKCNTLIGLAGEDPAVLKEAVEYLLRGGL